MSLIDVHRRELPRLLPVTFAYGLVMASLYVLKPARNALFLDRLGVGQLPYVLMLVALVGGLAALVFGRFSRRVALDRLVFATFAVLAACLVGFRLLLPVGWGWTYYLFYVWVNLYGLMATSLLWLLANALFNPREGRRLFGLIGSAGITGAIIGGVFTGWVVERVGTENLLLVCAADVAVCLLLLYPVRVRDAAGEVDDSGQSALKTVAGSQLLTLLAGMAGLAAAVAAVIDVQFNQIVNEAFADIDAKTAFFGEFFAGLSAFALLFQILVTPRVLRSAGVMSALLFLPISMALGSLAVIFVPGLAAGMLLKVGDGGLRHSIHKSATEILYLPVSTEAKKRTKVLLDTTVDNIATGLGAAVVTVALAAGLGYQHLSYVSLALVAGWLALVVRSRRAYVDTFRRALDRGEIDLSEYTVDINEAGALDSLVSVLQRARRARHLTYALDMLGGVRAQRLIGSVTALLDHAAPEVRQRALRVLQAQAGPMPLARFEDLLSDDHLQVRIEALHALCVHGEGDRVERLVAMLASPDPLLRGAAVGCIAEYGTEAENALVDQDLVMELLTVSEATTLLQVARLLPAIHDMQRTWMGEVIQELAASPHPAVVRELIHSLGRIGDDAHLPWLLERLDDRRTRRAAMVALEGFGDRAVELLATRVRDESLAPRSRQLAARALAAIATPACVTALFELMEGASPGLQYQLLKTGSKLRNREPGLDFPTDRVRAALRRAVRSYWELLQVQEWLPAGDGRGAGLLRRAVTEKRDQHLKRVFRCLALIYPSQDLYNAFLGYVGGERGARGSALEFLENALDREDRDVVVPLLDAPTPEAMVRVGRARFGAGFAGLEEALAGLLGGDDPWLRACVVYGALESGTPDLRARLQDLMRDPDPRVREVARQSAPGAG